MKKKLNFSFNFLFIAMILINTPIFSSTIYNESKYYDLSSLHLNTTLEVDYLTNRTNNGWDYDSDYKYKNDSTNKSTDWKAFCNSKLSMEGYFNYSEKIKTMFAFDVYGTENNSLWRPINDTNKKVNDYKENISLKKFEFNIKDYYYHVRYFKGIPHYNWKYSGDLFGFYQEQFETDKYLNISNRAVPEGVEIKYDFDYLGKLDLVYGEPIWGKKESIYANFKVNGVRAGVTFSATIAVDIAAAEVHAGDVLEKIIEECARIGVSEFKKAEFQFEGMSSI